MKKLICSVVLSAAVISLTMPDARGQYVLGVDVSSAQGSINWSSVYADGVLYAFAKATEGNYAVDADLAANMNNGKAAGLHMSAYDFARPDIDTPAVEANYFWNHAGSYIKADGKSLYPTVDFEVFNGYVGASSYTAWFNAWATDVKAKTSTFLHPIIYVDACTGACDLGTGIGLTPFIAATGPFIGVVNSPWANCPCCNAWDPCNTDAWAFWEFSDSGSISGISGPVSLDKFDGNFATLKATQGIGGS